jgi:hypothetical protein
MAHRPTRGPVRIHVTSKHELKERIMAGIDHVNPALSFIRGPTDSPMQPDMIQTKETAA